MSCLGNIWINGALFDVTEKIAVFDVSRDLFILLKVLDQFLAGHRRDLRAGDRPHGGNRAGKAKLNATGIGIDNITLSLILQIEVDKCIKATREKRVFEVLASSSIVLLFGTTATPAVFSCKTVRVTKRRPLGLGSKLGKWLGLLFSKPRRLLPQFSLIERVKAIGDVGGHRESDVIDHRGRRSGVTVTYIKFCLRCRPRDWLLCDDIRLFILLRSSEKDSGNGVRDSLGGDTTIHTDATAMAHSTHTARDSGMIRGAGGVIRNIAIIGMRLAFLRGRLQHGIAPAVAKFWTEKVQGTGNTTQSLVLGHVEHFAPIEVALQIRLSPPPYGSWVANVHHGCAVLAGIEIRHGTHFFQGCFNREFDIFKGR